MPAQAFGKQADLLTRSLVSGDFPLYAAIMQLPLRIVPAGEPAYVLRDEAALRSDFDLYHTVLKLHGVTDIFREMLGVHDEGNGVFRVECRVHILAQANRIAEPFGSEIVISQAADGTWRIREIRSTAGHIGWTLGQAEIGPARDFLKR